MIADEYFFISDGESTLEMNCEERLSHLQVQAETRPKASRKRRRDESNNGENNSSSGDSPVPTIKKPKLFEDAEQLIQGIPPEELENQRRKIKTGFKLYLLANRASALKEVDGDEKAAEKALNKGWTKISAMERRFYQQEALKLFKEGEEEEQQQQQQQQQQQPVVIKKEPVEEDEEVKSAEPPILPLPTESKEDSPDYILLDSEDEAFTAAVAVAAASNNDDNASVASSIKSGKSSSAKSTSSAVSEMIGIFKKEALCIICEEVSAKSGDLIKCKGVCLNSFHLECLGFEKKVENPETWKCTECESGKYSKSCIQRAKAYCIRIFHYRHSYLPDMPRD